MTTETEAGQEADAELERLRAERDELRMEVDLLSSRKRSGVRAVFSVLFVALACTALLAGVVDTWAKRNFLETDRFVSRAGPLIDEPSVQLVITNRMTEGLMKLVNPEALFTEVLPEHGQLLAAPLADAVEGFVHDQVASFVASEQFREIWFAAVRIANERSVKVLRGESDVVVIDDGKVTLNLVPAINSALASLSQRSPEILGRTVDIPDVSVEDAPDIAIQKIEQATGINLDDGFGQVTVYDDGKAAAAQDGVRIVDRAGYALLALAAAAAGIALWVSPRKRRTILQLAGGVVLAMVVLRRAGFRIQTEVAALPPHEEGQEAIGIVLHTFMDPLLDFAAWTVAGALVVALIAVVTGPYAWAVSMRRSIATGVRTAVTPEAVREHHDILLGVIGVLTLGTLWFADLSWLGVLLVLGIGGGLAALVHGVGRGESATSS